MRNMSCTSQNMIKRTVDGVNSFAGPFKYGLIYKNKLPGVEYYPVPCGRCNYCKLKKAKTWAARCTLEAMNWKYNYFITLTYDDEHLPLIDNYDQKLGSLEKRSNLVVRDLQLFFKRFRKLGYKLKYLASGEYGTQTERAHYHLIVFTDRPLQLKYYKLNENKDIMYTSETISKLWPYGFNVVATFTPATAAYVARYTLKKQFKNNYSFLKQSYKQEFLLCSRGIGFSNILKNIKSIADNKYISYSFQNNVQYMQLWNYAIKKLEELGYEKEALELTSFYRAKAARVNKVNNIGYENWVNKNDNLKYLFWLKSKKLNTKL